jgi:short-subunit dehydrogenase
MAGIDTPDSGSERPYAVVTGASSGIGLELAGQFAEHGFDVLACAEDEIPTDRIGPAASAVRADLRTPAGVDALYAQIARPVDALALNAGVGLGGAFLDQDLDEVMSVVALNVASTVRLSRLLLADMVARGSGRVLITSSLASTMPGPYQAVYNASKSFLQSFAQALQIELADSGVTVTSLMPGPTDTEFFDRAGMLNTVMGRGKKDDAATVARQGYEAMMAGRSRAVGGGLNTRAQYLAGLVLPDPVKSRMHAVMARPRR